MRGRNKAASGRGEQNMNGTLRGFEDAKSSHVVAPPIPILSVLLGTLALIRKASKWANYKEITSYFLSKPFLSRLEFLRRRRGAFVKELESGSCKLLVGELLVQFRSKTGYSAPLLLE